MSPGSGYGVRGGMWAAVLGANALWKPWKPRERWERWESAESIQGRAAGAAVGPPVSHAYAEWCRWQLQIRDGHGEGWMCEMMRVLFVLFWH